MVEKDKKQLHKLNGSETIKKKTKCPNRISYETVPNHWCDYCTFSRRPINSTDLTQRMSTLNHAYWSDFVILLICRRDVNYNLSASQSDLQTYRLQGKQIPLPLNRGDVYIYIYIFPCNDLTLCWCCISTFCRHITRRHVTPDPFADCVLWRSFLGKSNTYRYVVHESWVHSFVCNKHHEL